MTTRPNWVKDRLDCNTDLKFEALWDVIEEDVAAINAAPDTKRGSCTFRAERENEGPRPCIRVTRRERDGIDMGAVWFCKERDAIRVKGLNELTVTVQWNAATSSCDFLLNEEPCPLWQLSKRALEPLFFPAP